MPEPRHILFYISLLRDRAYQHLTAELKKRGVTGIEPSHGVILRRLYEKGPLPMSELARATGRTRPTVTVLVRKLVSQGYAARTRDRRDGRVVLVSLTDKALSVAKDLEDVSAGMRDTLFQGFDDKEKQALVELAARAAGNFSGKRKNQS